MKNKLPLYKNYIMNLIFPAFVFGSITGILTSIFVTLFKFCAKYAVSFSHTMYDYLSTHVYLLPLVLALGLGVAFLIALICKKEPNLRGGGIPASILAMRGITPIRWLRNLIGALFLPLISFCFGIPLGTEGPSVLIGTTVGKGSVSMLATKHKAWNKYSMTGGASAGFSVATGSPISGIMFAIEDVHGRISPMIVMVATISVFFSRITSELLDKIAFLQTDIMLFPNLSKPIALEIKDIWIPLAVGIIVGIMAVLFLNYYRAIYALFNKVLKKLPHSIRIFIVIALVLCIGIISFDFISTGHHLTESLLYDGQRAIALLFAILLVRMTLSLCANCNAINGGMFLPIMSLGAVLSSIIAKVVISLGVDSSYYTVIVMLGITACISSMMKTPLTAIFFAIEALSCYENILFIIVASIFAFIITEIFRAKSINDTIIERRETEIHGDRKMIKIDTYVAIKPGSFAIGKQIRDIFWPNGLQVLSVKRSENEADINQYGENDLRQGDIIHVRYATADPERTNDELYAIIGNQ